MIDSTKPLNLKHIKTLWLMHKSIVLQCIFLILGREQFLLHLYDIGRWPFVPISIGMKSTVLCQNCSRKNSFKRIIRVSRDHGTY